MVAWNDYKRAAKERGSLAMELYVVMSTPVAEPDALKAGLADHLAYQAANEQAGTLAFAGPLSDPTGEQMQGAGMIIYRAGSMDEARKLAEADPMHRDGLREFTLRKWLVNEGSLALGVQFSGSGVQAS